VAKAILCVHRKTDKRTVHILFVQHSHDIIVFLNRADFQLFYLLLQWIKISYDKKNSFTGSAVFDFLANAFDHVFSGFRSGRVLTQKDVDAALRKIRLALLEADVDFSVTQSMMTRLSEESVGQKVLKSLRPDQVMTGIMHDVLVDVLKHSKGQMRFSKWPSVVMMVGLQGVGKTTMCAKMAWSLKDQDKKVLLASVDMYRPAAREQLEILGRSINVDTLNIVLDDQPMDTAQRIADEASGYDVVIVDTAGRLHVDADMMQELTNLYTFFKPEHVVMTVDALSGQDTMRSFKDFQDVVPINGLCLSRVDADSRGGVALSLCAQTQKPVYFMGTGEKPSQVMPFDARRIADRVLDRGDVVELVEKARRTLDKKDQEKSIERLKKGVFTLDDFVKQIDQMKAMGGMKGLINLMPGMRSLKQQIEQKMDQSVFDKKKAIVLSMTPKERVFPSMLDASRKRRIAKGSGVDVASVNRLLKEFSAMQKMVKQMKKFGF
jgi:signal recognition particle subunit SRP54